MPKPAITKKKRNVTKTAAIRAELEKGVQSPKLISKHLAAQGLDVTPAYVSTIKSAIKKRGDEPSSKPGRPRSGDGKSLRANNGSDQGGDLELLETAFDLVVRTGVDDAHKLVKLAGRMLQRAQRS